MKHITLQHELKGFMVNIGLLFIISESLEAYMIVNLRTREISRGVRKLAQTPTLIKKKKKQVPHLPQLHVCKKMEG
jgi:hypothetical protein